MSDPMAEATDWLQGLAGMGCTFVELIPNGKQSKRPWTAYAHQVGPKGLASALGWLRRGSGVGILPMGPLWILDADSASRVAWIEETLLDAGVVPLKVKTPGGGAHFYLQLPAGFRREGLKNHLDHPCDGDGVKLAVDFKFGPKTLLVAPGTVRRGKGYEPIAPWRPPPVVDPRMFLPHGEFWRGPVRPFLVNTRSLPDRLAAARVYLLRTAPTSISGKGGNKTLAGVASHLVVFLGLEPSTAHNLMTHGARPWNTRCTRLDGSAYPWGEGELLAACEAAVGTVPAAGVKAFERQEQRMDEKHRLAGMVATLKASITRPASVRVPVEKILETFEWTGLPDLTAVALGDELEAQGIARVMATRKRIMCVPGLDLWAMQGRILEAERVRQDHEGRLKAGCPLLQATALIKQAGSLPPPPLGVESQVSAVSSAA